MCPELSREALHPDRTLPHQEAVHRAPVVAAEVAAGHSPAVEVVVAADADTNNVCSLKKPWSLILTRKILLRVFQCN